MNAAPPEAPAPAPPPRAPGARAAALPLACVLLLSFSLNLVALDAVGFGNAYFAAATWSMAQSPHALLYNGFDPAGFVTVDKPPLGFWIQVASVKLLGFTPLGLLLPTALAGTLSALLLCLALAPTFGASAGVLGALFLTLTPIVVAASRHNTHDMLLVATLLAATLALQRGVRRGGWAPFLLSGALIGLAFNIKMGLALVPLPGFLLYAALAGSGRPWRRLAQGALLAFGLLLVGGSWIALVDATPPERRPFVGGSEDNTALNLLVQKNTLNALPTLGRPLDGDAPPPSAAPPGPRPPSPGDAQPPPGSGGIPGPPPPPHDVPEGDAKGEVGPPGPLRLLNRQLGGQVAWLLPLALLGMVTALRGRPPAPSPAPSPAPLSAHPPPHTGPRAPLGEALLWAGWLLPLALLFSATPRFHRYYLVTLAVPLAALAALGAAALLRDPRRRGHLLTLGALAALAGALVWPFPQARGVVILPALAALGCALLAWRGRRGDAIRPGAPALVLALALAPMVPWSLTPALTGGDADLPFAGPELLERRSISAPLSDLDTFTDYIAADDPGERFFVGTWDARIAGHLMLATRRPVMAIGGYGGHDPILTAGALEEWVRLGEIRHFLLGPAPREQAELDRFIRGACEAAPRAQWLPPHLRAPGARQAPPPDWILYRCPG